MKFIFLDVDGVLNYEEFYTGGKRSDSYPLSEFCPDAVNQVNRIIENTGATVVLSSSWRHGRTKEEMNAILKEAGFKYEIYDFTPNLSYDKKCGGDWIERGNEILKWLIDNKHYNYNAYRITDHNYVIIDDDTDMLYQQKDNFFQTSPIKGLTTEIADKIITFLNHEEDTSNTHVSTLSRYP